ncbi:MAG TPA: indole-3-glycerol-phosphate synthase [Polyangiaceae bacterium]
MGVLDAIVAKKREEVAALKAAAPPPKLARTPIDVFSALERAPGDPLRLITEIKFKSPSAGPLSRALSAAERAIVYARGGATMISVLCDETFFDGSFVRLAEARAALDANALAVPLLAKEFVIDESQLDLARASGADAVLLIARIVDEAALPALVDAAFARGLEPIVEVVSDAEIERALATEARVFGVNARDLDTLKMDPARAAELVAKIPRGRVALHFSGIGSGIDVSNVARGRADGALLGEALMRRDDPSAFLAELVHAAK